VTRRRDDGGIWGEERAHAPAPEHESPEQTTKERKVLDLQQQAGNAAVTGAVQRKWFGDEQAVGAMSRAAGLASFWQDLGGAGAAGAAGGKSAGGGAAEYAQGGGKSAGGAAAEATKEMGAAGAAAGAAGGKSAGGAAAQATKEMGAAGAAAGGAAGAAAGATKEAEYAQGGGSFDAKGYDAATGKFAPDAPTSGVGDAKWAEASEGESSEGESESFEMIETPQVDYVSDDTWLA
jgi:hypothetical protein